MGKYLDMTGLGHLIAKIKALVDTKADKSAFTGATSTTAGTAGLVPAPSSGPTNRILSAGGGWSDPADVAQAGIERAAGNSSGYLYWDNGEGLLVDDAGTVLDAIGAQPTLVSGTSIKTVNSTSLLGSGNVAVQPTLVSGTNIKTINNQSILGSGNISISGGGSIDFGAEWDAEALSRANDAGDYGAMWIDEDEVVKVGGPLPIYYGGTGGYDAASARNNLGFGEVKTAASASVSAASGSNVNLRSLTLTKGTWLVCGRAQWPSNTTGRRAAKLSTTSQDSSNCLSTTSVPPTPGATTQLSVTRFVQVTAASQTVYLVGYHNIGSAQTCYGEMSAVRIG